MHQIPNMQSIRGTMWDIENIKQFSLKLIINDWFIGIVAVFCLLWLLKIWTKKCILPIACSKFGRTQASEHALKTVIVGVCNEIDSIVRARVNLNVKRGKLAIQLRLKLGTYSNLADLTTDLQNKLYTVLVDDLGLNNITKIDILISDFSGRKCAAQGNFLAECSCEKAVDQE